MDSTVPGRDAGLIFRLILPLDRGVGAADGVPDRGVGAADGVPVSLLRLLRSIEKRLIILTRGLVEDEVVAAAAAEGVVGVGVARPVGDDA